MKNYKKIISAVLVLAMSIIILSGCEAEETVKKILGTSPSPSASSEPSVSPEPTQEPAATQGPDAAQTASYYSTYEKPSIGDFEWFTNQIVPVLNANAVPDQVSSNTGISDRALAEGSWKMMIMWDPKQLVNSEATYYGNASITTSGDNVSFTVTLDLIMIPGEGTYDASGDGDVRCAGTWNSDNTFVATSASYQITMTAFYEKDGKQYGIGSAKLIDGSEGYVALVRP